MKRTFNKTFFSDDLRDSIFKLKLYNDCKLDRTGEYKDKDLDETVIRYTGVTSWDIIEGGAEAEEIEKQIDASQVDDYHEYLVLHFDNGETATFRNTYCDMFVID